MLTISAIKADVGSIGGHTRPSQAMLETARQRLEAAREAQVITDFDLTFTGDDICLLMIHRHGNGASVIHNLAWEIFTAAAEVARRQGLYGAGQDLLSDAFSGNVRGLGPGVAEIEFEERKSDPVIVFAADKTEPGAWNL
ncbi:MAG: fructose-1,6-bisphosphatase, partial [Caldilineales bacterium]|nr:fructose-1,6-bisphosphatase [Caldilineales bacterium]